MEEYPAVAKDSSFIVQLRMQRGKIIIIRLLRKNSCNDFTRDIYTAVTKEFKLRMFRDFEEK